MGSMDIKMQDFNGTIWRSEAPEYARAKLARTCRAEVLEASKPKGLHVDSVAIWNRTLSQAEIQSHYEDGIQLLSSRRTTFESRQLDFASGVAGITYYNSTEFKYDMNWSAETGNLTLGGGYGSNAVLYMEFDRNCTGTAGRRIKDWSGLANNGTCNATWTSTGKIGGGYTFDGIDDVINVTWS